MKKFFSILALIIFSLNVYSQYTLSNLYFSVTELTRNTYVDYSVTIENTGNEDTTNVKLHFCSTNDFSLNGYEWGRNYSVAIPLYESVTVTGRFYVNNVGQNVSFEYLLVYGSIDNQTYDPQYLNIPLRNTDNTTGIEINTYQTQKFKVYNLNGVLINEYTLNECKQLLKGTYILKNNEYTFKIQY